MRIPGVVSSERIAWQKENFSELFISSHVVLVETPEFHQVLGFCLRSEYSATTLPPPDPNCSSDFYENF